MKQTTATNQTQPKTDKSEELKALKALKTRVRGGYASGGRSAY